VDRLSKPCGYAVTLEVVDVRLNKSDKLFDIIILTNIIL
jgi:hypothetical protein